MDPINGYIVLPELHCNCKDRVTLGTVITTVSEWLFGIQTTHLCKLDNHTSCIPDNCI